MHPHLPRLLPTNEHSNLVVALSAPHFRLFLSFLSPECVCLLQPALIHLEQERKRQTRREGREDETSRTIDEGGKKMEALALMNAAAAQRGARATAINEIGSWWVCRGLPAPLAGTWRISIKPSLFESLINCLPMWRDGKQGPRSPGMFRVWGLLFGWVRRSREPVAPVCFMSNYSNSTRVAGKGSKHGLGWTGEL